MDHWNILFLNVAVEAVITPHWTFFFGPIQAAVEYKLFIASDARCGRRVVVTGRMSGCLGVDVDARSGCLGVADGGGQLVRGFRWRWRRATCFQLPA